MFKVPNILCNISLWISENDLRTRIPVLLTLSYCKYQGSRLRRPSMLNTRYFRFGRKFRLSVCPSGRDFYEENISALEANFGWQET